MERDVPRLEAVRVSRSSRRAGELVFSLLPDHRASHAWYLETQDRCQQVNGESAKQPHLPGCQGVDKEVLQAVSKALACSHNGDILMTPAFLLSKLPDII